jgi:hypothetical protein
MVDAGPTVEGTIAGERRDLVVDWRDKLGGCSPWRVMSITALAFCQAWACPLERIRKCLLLRTVNRDVS